MACLQVNFASLSLTNLTLEQYSVLNISSGTYNLTNGNIVGALPSSLACTRHVAMLSASPYS